MIVEGPGGFRDDRASAFVFRIVQEEHRALIGVLADDEKIVAGRPLSDVKRHLDSYRIIPGYVLCLVAA